MTTPEAQVVKITPVKPATPRAPKRKPVPRVVPWKVVWPAVGMLATAGVAVGLSWVPFIPAAVTVLGLTVVITVAAEWLMTAATVLIDHPKDTVKSYVHGVTAAALVHSGLVLASRDLLDPIVVGGALWVLGIVEYGVACAASYINNRRKARPRPDLDKAGQIITAALCSAGFGHLKVVRWSPLREPGEGPSGVSVILQLTAGGGVPPSNAAEQIGVALSEILSCPLRSDWVELISQPGVGEYELNVSFRETMDGVIPYIDDPRWRSITDPALVGYSKNKTPHYLTLCQHGEDIGKSRYGKSSLINTKLAHLTLCRDAVVWVIGAEKLYDLVAGWVEPYTDTDHPVPFDWIATGQVDVLEVLIAAMNVARWRQRQPLNARVGWPHIVIVLDEASFALRNRAVTGVYQGQRVNASQMAAMISQGAGSANVWLHRATQRSTNDHSGDHGGDVGANAGFSTAFASRDWAEVGRLMDDFKLPMPTHKGQYWLNSDEHDTPVKLKAPYIQEVDPSKPKLHDGVTVSDVAWARRVFVRSLDSGSAAAAGPVYARRHTRMNEEMRTYLTGEPAVPVGPSGAAQDGYMAVKAALAALEAPTEGSVTELTPRRTRADRIVDIVTESDRPLSPTEIVTALRAAGDTEAGEQVVTNALTKLVTENRLQRPERGLYVAG